MDVYWPDATSSSNTMPKKKGATEEPDDADDTSMLDEENAFGESQELIEDEMLELESDNGLGDNSSSEE